MFDLGLEEIIYIKYQGKEYCPNIEDSRVPPSNLDLFKISVLLASAPPLENFSDGEEYMDAYIKKHNLIRYFKERVS